MEGSYIDSACLLSVQSTSSCNIIKILPKHEIEKDHEIICMNSLICTKKPIVYCYTLFNNRIAYALAFSHNSIFYVITILSKKILPNLYTQFLKDCVATFSSSPTEISAESRLEYVYSTIKSWKNEPIYHQEIFFSATASYRLTKDVLTYENYNPFDHFKDTEEVMKAWKSVFLAEGILVTSNNPVDLYEGVFSIASLTAPIPFKGRILITNCSYDPRLSNLDEYEIVGVPHEAMSEIKRKFKIKLAASHGITDFSCAREKLLERSRKQKRIFLYLMDRLLVINPFNDLMNGPWIPDALESEMAASKSKEMLKAYQIRIAESTETIKQFRIQKRFRSAFRDAFLSAEPMSVYNIMSLDHLKKIPEILDEIQMNPKYKEDSHMKAVIKQYKKAALAELERMSQI